MHFIYLSKTNNSQSNNRVGDMSKTMAQVINCFFFYNRFPSGAVQEGTQHPEQADASEIQPADEAGDGPDHRHRREAQRGHRPGL